MSELNPKDNPRFYKVAHEFGLIVDNEVTLNRAERRDKTLMKDFNDKIKAEGLI